MYHTFTTRQGGTNLTLANSFTSSTFCTKLERLRELPKTDKTKTGQTVTRANKEFVEK